ncbi:hypothetical protein GTV32_17250 [Gordonia sp. SID5947]|nr:hypothetical protein [Gordonia sp. SID5947]
MCDTLVSSEPDLTYGKGLAKSIDQPDPTTYVFTLHDGVRFWNGDPLTAEDVEYSLAMHLDPAVATYYAAMYKDVESITATGPLEVTVKLRRPTGTFYNYLASPGGAIGQAKFMQAEGARYGTPSGGLMCSGPFEFVKWTPGKQIELRRNDDYWKPELRAHAAAMTFQFITSSNTMTQALQSGAIDGSFQISSASAPGLRNSGTGTLFSSTASTTMVALLPAASDGPITDVRIRRALSMAIDRAGLVEGVMPGLATPLDWMMPPRSWTHRSRPRRRRRSTRMRWRRYPRAVWMRPSSWWPRPGRRIVHWCWRFPKATRRSAGSRRSCRRQRRRSGWSSTSGCPPLPI